MEHHRHTNKGFTLLEIIAVLVIAAIAAAVATSVVSRSSHNLSGKTEALKAHIRYAQSLAMSTDDQNWGIRFQTGNDRYWLFYCSSGQNCPPGANITPIPGAEPRQGDRVDLGQADIGISSVSPGGNQVTLAFDNFGAPYYGTLNQVIETRLASEMVITLTDPAGRTETVRVTPTTGLVP